MPRFFFEISDGVQTLEDRKGSWLPDAATARHDAIRAIADLLKHHKSFFVPNWLEWHVLLKDEANQIEMVIPFGEICAPGAETYQSSGCSSFFANLPSHAFHASQMTV
jgi:hypothetical protein